MIQYITDFVRKSMKKVGKISPTSNSHFIRYTDFVDIFTQAVCVVIRRLLRIKIKMYAVHKPL